MGDEIQKYTFTAEEYQEYYKHLQQETDELKHWFENGAFATDSAMCGIEQEAWIVNHSFYPAPENQFLLDQEQSELLSPELAKFNIELNVTPQKLAGNGLSKMQQELTSLWKKCETTLEQKQLRMEMIGILPTIRDKELVTANMSQMNRYQALNEQVLIGRKGKPLRLDIVGTEHLTSVHEDVMLESAATSFQIHRQIPHNNSARYYNVSLVLSAAMVAVSANSPFLFSKQLWEETRIPLFEQAVDIGGYGDAALGPVKRVSFGTGYIKHNVFECFKENLTVTFHS